MGKHDHHRVSKILSNCTQIIFDFYDKYSVSIRVADTGINIAVDLPDISSLIKELSILGLFIDNLLFKRAGVMLHSDMMKTIGGACIAKKDIPKVPKIRLSKADVSGLIELHTLIGDNIKLAAQSGYQEGSKWYIASNMLFDFANSITNIYLKP